MRALWTLKELGLSETNKDYELVTMPFPPRIFWKEFTKINSLGTIPYLIDGETKMTESCAIPVYLVKKFGNKTLEVQPDEPDYGTYLNWLSHADATLTFPQTVKLRYTKLEPQKKLDKAGEDYGKWYIARLRLLDSVLADGREFLCANRFTIADICITYALFLGTTLELDEQYQPQTKKVYGAHVGKVSCSGNEERRGRICRAVPEETRRATVQIVT